jgi:hypothetical protein
MDDDRRLHELQVYSFEVTCDVSSLSGDMSVWSPFVVLFAPTSGLPIATSPYVLLPVDAKETDKDPRRRMCSGGGGGFSRGRGAVTFSSANGAMDMQEVCRTEIKSGLPKKTATAHLQYQKLLTVFTPVQPSYESDAVVRLALYHNKKEKNLIVMENEYLGAVVWSMRDLLALYGGPTVADRTLIGDLSLVPSKKLQCRISLRLIEVCPTPLTKGSYKNGTRVVCSSASSHVIVVGCGYLVVSFVASANFSAKQHVVLSPIFCPSLHAFLHAYDACICSLPESFGSCLV